jgi:hypothetical protein
LPVEPNFFGAPPLEITADHVSDGVSDHVFEFFVEVRGAEGQAGDPAGLQAEVRLTKIKGRAHQIPAQLFKVAANQIADNLAQPTDHFSRSAEKSKAFIGQTAKVAARQITGDIAELARETIGDGAHAVSYIAGQIADRISDPAGNITHRIGETAADTFRAARSIPADISGATRRAARSTCIHLPPPFSAPISATPYRFRPVMAESCGPALAISFRANDARASRFRSYS